MKKRTAYLTQCQAQFADNFIFPDLIDSRNFKQLSEAAYEAIYDLVGVVVVNSNKQYAQLDEQAVEHYRGTLALCVIVHYKECDPALIAALVSTCAYFGVQLELKYYDADGQYRIQQVLG